MINETLEKLIESFPEWKEQLASHSPDKEWEYSVVSPSGRASLIFSMSDRLNIKYGRESLEFFHADEAIDTLREITNDNLVCVEYYLDRDLASKLDQEPPDGIPQYQGGSLIMAKEISIKNSDWYFANRIKVVSWSGKLDSDQEGIYGQ